MLGNVQRCMTLFHCSAVVLAWLSLLGTLMILKIGEGEDTRTRSDKHNTNKIKYSEQVLIIKNNSNLSVVSDSLIQLILWYENIRSQQ